MPWGHFGDRLPSVGLSSFGRHFSKERLNMGLIAILWNDVIGRHSLHSATTTTTTSGDTLASGFNAQNDESILTRKLVLRQQFAAAAANVVVVGRLLLLLMRWCDERGGHSECLGIAGRPRIAIRIELAFTAGSGSVPDHLLWPDNVVEDVAIVETVNVVSLLLLLLRLSSRSKFAGPPAAEQIVPRAE